MVLLCKPLVASTISAGDIPFQLDAEFGDFVIQGLTVSTNSAQSTAVSVAVGSSVFKGFHIQETAGGSINCATSATNFIYTVLTLNASNLPTAVDFIATTAETQSNGYRLAWIVSTTKVSSVMMQHSMLPLNQVIFATAQQGSIF